MSYRFTSAPATDRWAEYDLHEIPLRLNGEETKYKAIIQSGEIAQIATNQYTVLPNEEAVKISLATAEEMGLVPFHEFTGNWFQGMESHVVKDGHKVHALYALNEPYTVNGDKMHIGVGVHNSIDGTTSFGVGIFTFRNACKNMVSAGSKGYHQDFDQRKTLEYVYRRHTSSIDSVIGDLSNTIAKIMDKSSGIIDAYRRMAERKADAEYLEELARKLNMIRLRALSYATGETRQAEPFGSPRRGSSTSTQRPTPHPVGYG